MIARTHRGALVLFAGAAAVSLGIACAYVAKRIGVEHARAEGELSRRHELETRLQDMQRAATAEPREAASGTPATERELAAGSVVAGSRGQSVQGPEFKSRMEAQMAWQRSTNERRRKSMADPQMRELVRAQTKVEMRREYPDLQRELSLSDAAYDQLLDLLTTQRLESRERYAQREPGTSFDMTEFEAQRRGERDQVAALLGHQTMDLYDGYMETAFTRVRVERFRMQLGKENDLSDEQARRFTRALHAASKRFEAEIMRENAQADGGSLGWMGAGLRLSAPGSSNQTMDEQALEQMARFKKYVRQDAAGILTAQQWREYERLEETEAAGVRVMLRRWATPRLGSN